jgi:mono/diheme cytochrome c family protein
MKKIAVAVAAVVMTACGPMTQADQVAALTGTASAGQALYASTCASCHGANGKGTGSGVDLFEPLKNDPATEIIETILNGKTGTAMSAYKTVLTNQQVADLYAYMKATFK